MKTIFFSDAKMKSWPNWNRAASRRYLLPSLIVPGVLPCGILATLLLASVGVARASDGYEAMGHLTFTHFDASGKPKSKNVMMFDVKVAGTKWRIRTEPVIECMGGIGFFEASR